MSEYTTVQDSLEQFIKSLPCRLKKPYPTTIIKNKNEKLANLLLNAFADGNNAEFTAIAQYTQHALTIKEYDVRELELCIGIVEMYHLQLIGRLITGLGGKPKYWGSNHDYWSGGNVSYGNTLCEKLSADIASEEFAISAYHSLLRDIKKEETPEADVVRTVILRIIEDEQLHLKLFRQAYQMYCQ